MGSTMSILMPTALLGSSHPPPSSTLKSEVKICPSPWIALSWSALLQSIPVPREFKVQGGSITGGALPNTPASAPPHPTQHVPDVRAPRSCTPFTELGLHDKHIKVEGFIWGVATKVACMSRHCLRASVM
ncbi:hypothetical protein MSG28_001568 [Choristoneura fumiferana]|uniref:Uncharacterized protein n=1 Tax=Choristoneura fumiferana TaxID=7141 RepID=A0ACC0KUJ5_CHOFU|nr:hypothetical protein MSG28_001568 [Choristoneura fumiferana]